MRIILPILSMIVLLAGCASSNSNQMYAAMSGMNVGATLGGAIGGLTSRSPRGYHKGTMIGALSGAAIGAIATSPRHKRSEREYNDDTTPSHKPSRKGKGTQFAPLSGIRSEVRVTNVVFYDSSGDGILQPGETATVSYDIINVTPREIALLIPKIELSSQAKRIDISPMQSITNILPGEGVRYSVTLTAAPRLKSGETSLTLSLSRDNGATYTAVNTIQISTKK